VEGVQILKANRFAEVGTANKEDRDKRATGLSVFWLAPDMVSHHGLPPLLKQVRNVGHAVVERCPDQSVYLIASERFDIVVLPFFLCTETLHRTILIQPHTRLLVTLRDQDVQQGHSLIQSHATDGYLLQQDIEPARLSDIFEQIGRVRAIASSKAVPQSKPAPTKGLTDQPHHGTPVSARLTERERTVLALLSQGLSNQLIARSMGISIHGVKRHVSNLLMKFNCSNRTELALATIRLGIAAS
jgi:DNA-binding NarL/FixJ family response regulator